MNDPQVHIPGASSLAMALLFGSIAFATASLAARTYLMGDTRAIHAAFRPKAEPLDVTSYASLYTFLHHCTVLGGILLFAYVCEYHPPFAHGEKSYDRDEFLFLTALLFVASAYTITKNDRSKPKPAASSKLQGSKGDVSAASTARSAPQSKSPKKKAGNPDAMEDISLDQDANDDIINLISSPKKDKGSAADAKPKMRKRTGSSGALDVLCIEEGVSVAKQKGHKEPTKKGADRLAVVQYPLEVASVKACDDVLNRDQTEEWKGWMQFMFLLYHYYHAEEVYNSIRVMITCYVWMTGFGNFSFFYLKNDFSLVRVLQMMWRLNFLVLFLCMSQGTTYILYYICPLHTYFFLMVYATMRIGKSLNYSRMGLRLKLLGVAIVIFMVWDCDLGLFQLLHMPFVGTTPGVGAGNGSMWEWYFRSTLDHWSTFLGMIFALNYPIISLFFRKLEAQHPVKHWGGKIATGLALSAACYTWIIGPYQQNKLDYNATNCYFGFIPLITYIFFRNLTPTLRSYSLDLLHQIGKTTLETYLMQHHIWLTSDAKSLLILVPGYPKINMLLVTCIYYLVSRRLYKLTLFLRGMLLPDDKAKCLQSLTVMGVILGMFYALAYSLLSIHVVTPISVTLVCMVGGFLLYQSVMDASWLKYRETSPASSGEADAVEPRKPAPLESESPVAKLSPPLIGAIVLFILSTAWQGITANGAGKIMPLPDTCEADVNQGTWVNVNGCNMFDQGVEYRSHDVSSLATCGNTSVWGWFSTPSNSLCRFSHRSPKQLKKQLGQRNMVFIGDSMTRSVFHAFARAMGETDAGAYDATVPKHSDIHKVIGNTRLEFRWAPMAQDVVTKLKEYNAMAGQPQDGEADGAAAPDTIFLGGGAWDRLHVWATGDTDHAQLKSNLQALAAEMTQAKDQGMPTVWMNPTTINTKALLHEDKRQNLKEEDMQEMRDLTAAMGVWAASTFVLDGTAFTHERVDENYDGVHYPSQVYDAGAQILANALDWVLPDRYFDADFVPPTPGTMSNPMLGVFMLSFVAVGLFFYDGLMGFSYFASVCADGVMPNEMYEEAFEPLHRQMKLPPIQKVGGGMSGAGNASNMPSMSASDEILSLLSSPSIPQRNGDIEFGGSINNRSV